MGDDNGCSSLAGLEDRDTSTAYNNVVIKLDNISHVPVWQQSQYKKGKTNVGF